MNHPNRPHKSKVKKGSGCKMCKPQKGGWGPRMKETDRPEPEERSVPSRKYKRERLTVKIMSLYHGLWKDSEPKTHHRYRNIQEAQTALELLQRKESSRRRPLMTYWIENEKENSNERKGNPKQSEGQDEH